RASCLPPASAGDTPAACANSPSKPGTCAASSRRWISSIPASASTSKKKPPSQSTAPSTRPPISSRSAQAARSSSSPNSKAGSAPPAGYPSMGPTGGPSSAMRVDPLPAVAQTRGEAVDGQMDPGHDILIRVAGAIALQQLDLHVIERIQIGEAVADRARQQRIALEQALLVHDREQRVDR